MNSGYTVSLAKIINEFSLEKVFLPENEEEIMISSAEINRPGLQFNGFFEFFDEKRIQIIGKSEESFINSFPPEEFNKKIDLFFSKHPAAVVVTRGLDISDKMIEAAQKYSVPLLRTDEPTSQITAAVIAYLNVQLAQRVTRHGVMVEVYGEGILILGESGVGKSETAIELVKRGHRLIADDAVEIRKLSHKSLVGQSPENIQNFIELRGVGIINIARTYGASAVKQRQEIDMVIELENWKPDKSYSTTGLTDEYTDILGVSVVKSVIPVRPGRNISIVIETAAVVNRQKKMGYFAAKELLKQLGIDE